MPTLHRYVSITFQKEHKVTKINHIFFRCASKKPFWEQLQMAINDRDVNAVSITLNESIVLFGHNVSFRSDDTFNLIILVANFFVYKCKIKKIIPQFHFFKQYLRNTFEIYKHNSKVNMFYNKFMTSWHLYKTAFQNHPSRHLEGGRWKKCWMRNLKHDIPAHARAAKGPQAENT